MKIILLQSYEKLGKVGEIINVKPGFARNYLIPNKIASLATGQNIKVLEVFLKAQETQPHSSIFLSFGLGNLILVFPWFFHYFCFYY